MNLPLYCMIFFSKVIENALATLRLIVVANGKKWLGAILQFIVALVWVFVTGAVVTGIKEDPFKIIIFAIGSFVGSYVGSIIEEKLALGNNMITAIIDPKFYPSIIKELKKERYGVTILEGNKQNKIVLLIVIPRKERIEVTEIITKYDSNAFISAEKVVPISQTHLQHQ
ncbi:MAG: DUF2179 domain-containing protein [Bacilli bacterium]|nr:DUF2179 domain-containing protein [Bacilli bacterium]